MDPKPVGFIGFGIMGEPMARNLLRSGYPLVVWNRTAAKLDAIAAAGARIARSSTEVFDAAKVIIIMLSTENAVDLVTGRADGSLARKLAGRTLINMGTTSPEYSVLLERDIQAVGGHYVEAPVSGSRIPAETGDLIALLAGSADVIAEVEHLFAPMCRTIFQCGPVPGGLTMKLAANLFLIVMVSGLTEAFHFAAKSGLDLEQVRSVLDAGPMASNVSRLKSVKIANSDFAAQATVADVLRNVEIIQAAAARLDIGSPLLSTCQKLFAETVALQHSHDDMIAIWHALTDSSNRLNQPKLADIQ